MITDIAKNKKAFFDYEIIDSFEAGIILTGLEIKQVRAKNVNLRGSYVKILSEKGKPTLFAVNINIAKSAEPDRTRKLLMHKKEVQSLTGKMEQKKLTLVPLSLYLKNKKWAKLQVGLVRGRKHQDKRTLLRERDQRREAERAIKEYY